ncbi:hypothetical protein PR002_g1163 [Phytophthora rubi]|uniref:Uncharacterized protein n=1 Tax=Phytophthora rubi TaxID=129364 RepID=A0A6A3NRM1_9STRA|nr:hypothetical protein PR002_g1163 [Phytophthora rubi]
MANGSLAGDLIKQATVDALTRAFANARSIEADSELMTRVVTAGDAQEGLRPATSACAEAQGAANPDSKVDRKTKRRGFNEVRWDEIEAAYTVKHKRLVFKPTPVPLSPAQQRTFRDHVDVVVATSPQDVNFWTEDNMKEMARSVFRYAATPSTMSLSSKGDQDSVIVECKRDSANYSKGMEQMVLEEQTLLAKKLENNSPNTCIYDLLTGSTGWTGMYLDSKEGRFHGTAIDPQHVKYSAEKMAAIAVPSCERSIRHDEFIRFLRKIFASTTIIYPA